MTKEEFLSMVDKEIDNLEQEQEEYARKLDYYQKVSRINQQELIEIPEYRDTKYLLEVVQKRILYLNERLHQPAYERIQAMSDLEIKKYQQDKIEGLELDKKNVERKRKEAKEELKRLEEEQNKLIIKGGILTQEEEIRGRQIFDKINYGLRHRFDEIEKEMQEIKTRQEQIKKMTSQEVKKQMISKISGKYETSEQVINNDEFKNLQLAVAEDPEKAHQMAKLMTSYSRIKSQQLERQGLVSIFYNFDAKTWNIVEDILIRNDCKSVLYTGNETDLKEAV